MGSCPDTDFDPNILEHPIIVTKMLIELPSTEMEKTATSDK